MYRSSCNADARWRSSASSGSGKSVTALSIVRLLGATSATFPSGEIFFQGEDLLKASEAHLREVRGKAITMVFQEPMTSLNPLHTIARQIGEILELHGMRGAAKLRARIVELLEEVGIVDPAARLAAYPHQLSGGQRQRVMIAMALANRPDLFIADEPTTALDVTVQAQILTLLKDLQGKLGMAMLFITHDLGIVRKLADDVAVMQRGRIVEAGPVAEIFSRPQHAYTRALLAAEPKGEPPEADAQARPVVTGRGHQGVVPDQARLPAPHRRLYQGGRRRLARRARRPDARHRRRIRAPARRRSGWRCCGSSVRRGRSPISAAASTAGAARRCGPCGATCRSSFRTPMGRCRRACRSPESSRKG